MGLGPTTTEQLATILRAASDAGSRLTPRGGGTRARSGRVVDEGEPLQTSGLTGIVEHIPAELTVTVRAGTPTTTLVDHLAEAGQWWPQADLRPGSTVGGTIAAAASGRRRLRYGPIRDSLLEVVLVTGDGRVVRGGGPTVKGVAGYDLPRLMCGSRGTLGVITQVTLKLTPLPAVRQWWAITAPAPERLAQARALLGDPRRPSALIMTPGRLWVELAGVSDDAGAPDGFTPADAPAEPAGAALVDIGVPPARLGALVGALEAAGLAYLAECGVGVCRVALSAPAQVSELRALAAGWGGHLVVSDAPEEYRADPWGPAPSAHAIMERMRHAFDPAAILSPAHRPEPA